MSDVVNSRHNANIAVCQEDLGKDIHHRGKAIGGQITQVGKDTKLGRVDVDLDVEALVNEKQLSIQVESNK